MFLLEFFKIFNLHGWVADLDASPPPLRRIKFPRMYFGKDNIFIFFILLRLICFVRGIRAMFCSFGMGKGGCRCANAQRSEET
jgi:hypothetical protein